LKSTYSRLVLEGANPSAEGEDADEGGEGASTEKILNLADQFRYQKMEGVSKKAYQADLKGTFSPLV
jgi:Translationally controlled tumour protein